MLLIEVRIKLLFVVMCSRFGLEVQFHPPVSSRSLPLRQLSLGLDLRTLLSRVASLTALVTFIIRSMSQPDLLTGDLDNFWNEFCSVT